MEKFAPTIRTDIDDDNLRFSVLTEETFLITYNGPDNKKIVHLPKSSGLRASLEPIRGNLAPMVIKPKIQNMQNKQQRIHEPVFHQQESGLLISSDSGEECGQSDALSLSAGDAIQVRGSQANNGVVEDPKQELPTAETLPTE